MEEFAPGYRFDETVLIGIPTYSLDVECLISSPIAYNRTKDAYFLSVDKRQYKPGAFPQMFQGSIVPDEEEMEMVRKRDPSMAFWTSWEIPAFPEAAGFFAAKDLVQIMDYSKDDKLFRHFKYLERTDEGNMMGFGKRPELLEMAGEWRATAIPIVEDMMRDYLVNKSSYPNPQEDYQRIFERLTLALFSLGRYYLESCGADSGYEDGYEEDNLRFFLATEEITGKKFSDEELSQRTLGLNGLRQKLDEFKEKFMR